MSEEEIEAQDKMNEIDERYTELLDQQMSLEIELEDIRKELSEIDQAQNPTPA